MFSKYMMVSHGESTIFLVKKNYDGNMVISSLALSKSRRLRTLEPWLNVFMGNLPAEWARIS